MACVQALTSPFSFFSRFTAFLHHTSFSLTSHSPTLHILGHFSPSHPPASPAASQPRRRRRGWHGFPTNETARTLWRMELRAAQREDRLSRAQPCTLQGVFSRHPGAPCSPMNLLALAFAMLHKPIACALVQPVHCFHAACLGCRTHAAPVDHWTQAYLLLTGPGSIAALAHNATHSNNHNSARFDSITIARIFDTST